MSKSKRILYFGLDPSRYGLVEEIIHFPLIQTRPFPFEKVQSFFLTPHSHVLFTSRTAVTYYFRYTDACKKNFVCVGAATAERLADFGVVAAHVAEEACAEGVIELLKQIEYTRILYPHSAKARRLLPEYLQTRGIPFALYDTFFLDKELPDLSEFDTLVFTSPTTVEAFRRLCSTLPPREKCEAIGPITQIALNKLFDSTILNLKP